jgi:hypothetical protein
MKIIKYFKIFQAIRKSPKILNLLMEFLIYAAKSVKNNFKFIKVKANIHKNSSPTNLIIKTIINPLVLYHPHSQRVYQSCWAIYRQLC